MEVILAVLWVVCSVALWWLYHKLFDVVYFSLADGLFKEIIVCGLLGGILAACLVYFWYITIPLVIIIAIIVKKRRG
ncbi:MAG: hypothetical protein IJW53_02395 [Clostridia bacterium]|nr:hypothetical protein [Clostridia bacterium]